MPSPATANQSPHLATTTAAAAPGVSVETEHSILRAQIPTQVRRHGRVRRTTISKNGDGLAQDLGRSACDSPGAFVLFCRDQRDGRDLHRLHNSDGVRRQRELRPFLFAASCTKYTEALRCYRNPRMQLFKIQ